MLIKLTRINAVPLLVEHTAIQVIDPMKETGGTMVVLLSGIYAPVIEDADFVSSQIDIARRSERFLSLVSAAITGVVINAFGEGTAPAATLVNDAGRCASVYAHKALEFAEAKCATTPKLETPAYTPPKPNAGLTIVTLAPKQH